MLLLDYLWTRQTDFIRSDQRSFTIRKSTSKDKKVANFGISRMKKSSLYQCVIFKRFHRYYKYFDKVVNLRFLICIIRRNNCKKY